MRKNDILSLVNDYIGVSGGYLGDFTYRTHAEFYPQYCDLDVDVWKHEGTTRLRFIKILEDASTRDQAKIIRGTLQKYPVDYFPEEQRARKSALFARFSDLAGTLEKHQGVDLEDLTGTSEAVEHAIADVEALLRERGASSGVDRIHTALHAYLIAVVKQANIPATADAGLPELFKLLRASHSRFAASGPRSEDLTKVLRSLASLIDVLSPIRNRASLAHPNPELLEEPEARLVIDSSRTLLNYVKRKLSNP